MRSPPPLALELFFDFQKPCVGGVGGRERLETFGAVRLRDDHAITGRLIAADFAADEIGATLEEVEH